MGVNWTPEQENAIRARGGTILVSAAAGSGKTAVLVQRTIDFLTDKEAPVPADKLLIVTFTRAAASEMRARLEKSLNKLIRENPGNKALKRQSILLAQASIGTIHSFCADILREFFHVAEISQDFKIIGDKQKFDMKNAAVADVMDTVFSDPEYLPLVDAFTTERNDRKLTEVILNLYEYMCSHPSPEKWLREKVEMYYDDIDPAHSPWGKVVLKEAGEQSEYCTALLSSAIEISKDDDKLFELMGPFLNGEFEMYKGIHDSVLNDDWDTVRNKVLSMNFNRFPSVKGYKDDPLKNRIKELRDESKKIADGKLKRIFKISKEQCIKDFEKIGGIVTLLEKAVLMFSQIYNERKSERSFLDYNDLEQLMLKLLYNDDKSLTKSAQELSGRFDLVMVDEYQDVNEVQDKIFTAVSRDRKNIFMVGDVKQSIYSFRRAMPDIFIGYHESYSRYNRENPEFPAYISLDRNFRSRENVTDTVNYIFSKIMNKNTCGIEYKGKEELVCGASYEKKLGCETEIDFITRDDSLSADEAEGMFIAKRIRDIIDSGFTVTDGGKERNAEYKDFCILLRSANKHAHLYSAQLQKYGIPSKAVIPGGFFKSREIQFIMSFLRLIDNPIQDIPLMAVMISPVFGFTEDDIAGIKKKYQERQLYFSVLKAANEDNRYKDFLEDVSTYRTYAVTLPSDTFLDYLYHNTGYADIVLAMENGEERLANLRALQEYAKEYESTGYNGIYGFLRFLENLRESGNDIQVPVSGGSGNCVNIMSIHKSKGLEFPICILAGCSRGNGNHTEEVLLHPELGLGIRISDVEEGLKYNTMPREAIIMDTARKESAEEMRILYVALTRAKEKLIIVSAEKNLESTVMKQSVKLSGGEIPDYVINNSKNFSEWIIQCAL